MPNGENSGILIYAQLTRENYIHTVFFELLDKSKELASKLGGVEINAVIFTTPNLINEFRESFQNMGLDKVYCFENDLFKNYSTEYYSKLIVNLVNDIKPEIFLIGATTQGRDLAPRISSALHTGLTADCTGLDINENGETTNVKNLFVAGEAVGGIHGRNRLMGNSLLDIIVFGRNAGIYAAAKAKETATPEKLTLEHINKFNKELEECGAATQTVSPMLLPHYARKDR